MLVVDNPSRCTIRAMRESSGRTKDGEHTYLIAFYQLLRLLINHGNYPLKTSNTVAPALGASSLAFEEMRETLLGETMLVPVTR